jgi:hypothetical protein
LGLAQPNLFAEEDIAPKRYVPKHQYVRNRLQSLLDEMPAATKWPWEPVIVSLRCCRGFTSCCLTGRKSGAGATRSMSKSLG